MPSEKIDSVFLWEAALRSERLRVLGLLFLFTLAGLFAAVRKADS
jgi:hypothetical protein